MMRVARFFQLWYSSKKMVFLKLFSIFNSNLPPEDDIIEKSNAIGRPHDFHVDFKNLICFVLTIWEIV